MPADEIPMSISRSIVNHVLLQKKAILSQDAGADKNLPTSASIADLKIRSVMCVPLLTPDKEALGIIQLDTSDRKQFGQEDLDVLAAVAGQAAISIQNAQMHESLLERERLTRDLKLAEQVQKRFLPQSVPVIAGLRVLRPLRPGLRGWRRLLRLRAPARRQAGDRRGRRLGQGRLGRAHDGQVLGRYAVLHPDRKLSVRGGQRAEQPALLGRHRGEIHHPESLCPRPAEPHALDHVGGASSALIRRSNGTIDEVGEEIAGFPLGIVPEGEYQQTQVTLEPGDVVAVFSDGVTDARNLREELYESRDKRRLM